MAKARFIGSDDFSLKLDILKNKTPEIVEKVLYTGAAIIADEMKKRLKGVLSEKATGQLVEAFGITPIATDHEWNYNVHMGFDGYQTPGHGKFKVTGVPFQLIARSFESGAGEWRKKTPFAAPAVKEKKEEAIAAMERVANEEWKKIISRR